MCNTLTGISDCKEKNKEQEQGYCRRRTETGDDFLVLVLGLLHFPHIFLILMGESSAHGLSPPFSNLAFNLQPPAFIYLEPALKSSVIFYLDFNDQFSYF